MKINVNVRTSPNKVEVEYFYGLPKPWLACTLERFGEGYPGSEKCYVGVGSTIEEALDVVAFQIETYYTRLLGNK